MQWTRKTQFAFRDGTFSWFQAEEQREHENNNEDRKINTAT